MLEASRPSIFPAAIWRQGLAGGVKSAPGFFMPGNRRTGMGWQAYIAKYP